MTYKHVEVHLHHMSTQLMYPVNRLQLELVAVKQTGFFVNNCIKLC